MEFSRKDKFLIFLILLGLIIYLPGIKWGLPSRELNGLYFYEEKNLKRTLEEIKKYKEPIWKGYGYYFALHPEEEEKKLPRNLYNPIRSYHPDEYFVIKVLASMNPGKFDFNPYQFAVGGVYLYLVGVFLFLFSKTGIIKLTKDLNFYFFNPGEIGKFYIVGRTITTFYGIGVLILSFLISKKIFKKEVNSFLTAILILFSPLIILNSSYMYVDIPGLFWVMMCLYFSIKTLENPSYKNFFLTGIFSGLACGTKISLFVSIFIPFITSILIYSKNIKKIILSLIYITGSFLISFGITNPYFFITFPLPLVELKQHTPLSFSGKFYLNSLGYGIGLLPFILCVAGIFLNKDNFKEKNRILLFIWCIFYFLFISVFSKNYARYILPVVPPLIILGINYWLENFKIKILRKTILFFCFLYSFLYGLSYKSLLIKENVRTEAGKWIKENIPYGKSIGVCEVPWQFQMPPFDYFVYKVKVINYDFEKLKKELPDYFIISSFQGEIPPYPSNLQKKRIDFWRKFINSNLYSPLKTFQKFPSTGIIKFKFRKLPEDLIYINPTIIIFKKNE